MKKVNLNKGLNVQALSKTDAKVIYHEIWQMQSYGKHGIVVNDFDTIIDVGANIGLFSIHLAQQRQGLQFYAFEPVQPIYECLTRNSEQHLSNHNVQLFNSGLSSQTGNAAFSFCKALSMVAGMYSKELSKQQSNNASVFDWTIAMIQDMQRAGIVSPGIGRPLVTALTWPIIRILLLVLLLLPMLVLLLYLRLTTRTVTCSLTTLSNIIKEESIATVHLVKIDVEGAELDVLRGIDADDFKKIKQLVIEVHNIDSRVQTITKLLQQHNFTVITDREDWSLHPLMNIYTIFAKRN